MNYLHNIPARLYDNKLTEDAGDLFARIEVNKSLGIADICRSATERGGAQVDPQMMELCVRKWLQEALYRMCDGFAVNAEYFQSALHVKGSFGSPQDRFDPQRHRIVCEYREGALTRAYIDANASIDVRGKAEDTAYISGVKDAASGRPDVFTFGSNMFVSGKKIKVEGDNPDIGVYFDFVQEGGVTGIAKLPSGNIVVNNPSELVLLMPADWHALTMRMIIKTQFSGSSKPLRDLRTIEYNNTLLPA